MARAKPLILSLGGLTHVGTKEEADGLRSFRLPWSRSAVTVDDGGNAHEIPLDLPDGFATRTLLPLEDGGFLALGSIDTMPGTPRADGPEAVGVEFPLVRLDHAGRLVSQSNVRIPGEDVALLGASGATAYLERGMTASGSAEVVARDLTSGSETVVAQLPIWARTSDLFRDQLVLVGAGSNGGCEIHSLDVASGSLTNPADKSCSGVQRVSVSPDGQELALVSAGSQRGSVSEMRLSVRDANSGAVVRDSLIGRNGPYGAPQLVCGAASCDLVDVGGIAWLSDGTVEVAVVRHPDDGDLRSLALSSVDAVRV